MAPQLEPTPGLPVRKAVQRRTERVMKLLHTMPPNAREAVLAGLDPADRARIGVHW
jgi:phospholipid/cholesterol/gamma-HCH transport system ATP-binding protein